MEQESVVDGNLATEASLIVLDTLEIVVKVKQWRKKKLDRNRYHAFCHLFTHSTVHFM